jgi:hypothetical protein
MVRCVITRRVDPASTWLCFPHTRYDAFPNPWRNSENGSYTRVLRPGAHHLSPASSHVPGSCCILLQLRWWILLQLLVILPVAARSSAVAGDPSCSCCRSQCKHLLVAHVCFCKKARLSDFIDTVLAHGFSRQSPRFFFASRSKSRSSISIIADATQPDTQNLPLRVAPDAEGI